MSYPEEDNLNENEWASMPEIREEEVMPIGEEPSEEQVERVEEETFEETEIKEPPKESDNEIDRLNETEDTERAADNIEQSDKISRGVFDAAKVFGVSEGELQNEFNRYKAEKLFTKIAVELTNPELCAEEISKKLGEAAAFGLSFATVLPNSFPFAIKARQRIDLVISVCYPFGAATFKEKRKLVKHATTTAAKGVELCFDNFSVREIKKPALIREYKKLLKNAKKKRFIVNVAVGELTPAEMKNISDILFAAGVKEIKLTLFDGARGETDLITFMKFLKDRFVVTVCLDTEDTETVMNALSDGAAFVSCYKAVAVGKSFKEKLDV